MTLYSKRFNKSGSFCSPSSVDLKSSGRALERDGWPSHLPRFRFEQITALQGVPLARLILGNGIGRICVALQQLTDRLTEILEPYACLHVDEIPIRQLHLASGKTRHT